MMCDDYVKLGNAAERVLNSQLLLLLKQFFSMKYM